MSNGTGNSGNTTGDGSCTGTETFEMDASEATLQGWSEEPSVVDQGSQIYPNGMVGTATFALEIPCDDIWHIWVYAWDQGSDDSLGVRVDGMPVIAPATFDIDCTAMPVGEGRYRWAHLNQRALGGCDVDDWWEVDLAAGTRDLVFSPQSSAAISRIVVTNDASFMP